MLGLLCAVYFCCTLFDLLGLSGSVAGELVLSVLHYSTKVGFFFNTLKLLCSLENSRWAHGHAAQNAFLLGRKGSLFYSRWGGGEGECWRSEHLTSGTQSVAQGGHVIKLGTLAFFWDVRFE